jgi:hypothetical protein
MSRGILVAAAVAALLAAPGTAHAGLRGEVAAMEVVAAKYWDDRGVPAICTSVDVRIVSKLHGHASVGEATGDWQLVGDAWGWVTNCKVMLDRSWFRARLNVRHRKRASYALACAVVTHELGHTRGRANWALAADGTMHDTHPALGVMAPYTTTMSVPGVCRQLAKRRAR